MTALSGRRLVFVFQTYALGGSERQALHLAKHLLHVEGATLHFVAQDDRGPVRDAAEAWGIPCHVAGFKRPNGSLRSWWRQRQFFKMLRALRPELLLPVTVTPNVVCGLAWRSVGARGSIWRQADAGLSLSTRASQRRAVLESSIRIANSPAAVTALRDRYALSEQAPVELVPNGVDLAPAQRSAAEVRQALGVPDETHLVTMVGNLTPYKDHDTLLEAWARLGERPHHLVLAGRDGGEGATLQARAAALGIADRVHFVGFTEDVRGLLEASDLAVLSSKSESCPGSLLEAMALGIPVVATANAGSAFVLEGVVDGDGLPPAGDATALAEAIAALLDDPTACAARGAAGRERVATEFSIDAMVAAWTQHVRGLLD